jgi:phenylpyruvate tautomerase
MPYLHIRTNLSIDEKQSQELLTQASQRLAQALGKPERYVLVEASASPHMLFAGNDEPAAYVELKNIGLSDTKTRPLSQLVCELLQAQIGIKPDRIYIEFTDINGKFWGWNSGTF